VLIGLGQFTNPCLIAFCQLLDAFLIRIEERFHMSFDRHLKPRLARDEGCDDSADSRKSGTYGGGYNRVRLHHWAPNLR
jgi:hypothetical protein